MPISSDELPVGRIAGVFGVHGELKCDPTSAGRTLFSRGALLRLELAGGSSQTVQLTSVREHKNRLLIHLPGVENADEAQPYVGATFYANRERIVLEPGEYLDCDLIGCSLYDESGKHLGTVTRVDHYPSSDMLVVGNNLVPMISQFIKSIDVGAKRIVVEVPPGLLDEDYA